MIVNRFDGDAFHHSPVVSSVAKLKPEIQKSLDMAIQFQPRPTLKSLPIHRHDLYTGSDFGNGKKAVRTATAFLLIASKQRYRSCIISINESRSASG